MSKTYKDAIRCWKFSGKTVALQQVCNCYLGRKTTKMDDLEGVPRNLRARLHEAENLAHGEPMISLFPERDSTKAAAGLLINYCLSPR